MNGELAQVQSGGSLRFEIVNIEIFFFFFYRYCPPLYFGALHNGYTRIAYVKIHDVFIHTCI
jgi:hypothetical protein